MAEVEDDLIRNRLQFIISWNRFWGVAHGLVALLVLAAAVHPPDKDPNRLVATVVGILWFGFWCWLCLSAARELKRMTEKGRSRSRVFAIANLFGFPIGTIVGWTTLTTLKRAEVRGFFRQSPAS